MRVQPGVGIALADLPCESPGTLYITNNLIFFSEPALLRSVIKQPILKILKARHTPRCNNERAYQLARLASSQKPGQLRSTIHLELPTSSIPQECMPIEEPSNSWMTGIMNFIVNGSEPADPIDAKKIQTKAARYSMVAGELYRRGFSTPLLKCLDQQQADYVIREVHEGICGFHSGGRTLAAKVLRAGYYWPTLKTDCAEYVKKCKQCQQHGNLIHASAEQLHTVSAPWPFALWGIDILGPFPLAKGQCKFLVVAVDYFTKWIEAEPLATITAANVQKFVWKNIITRCTPQSSTRETLFRLAYRTDAMIPVEVGEPSFRCTHFHEESNDGAIRAELDVIDEVRDRSQIIAEACKQRMSRRFNSKLKPRNFQEGDLVWRVSGSARRNLTEGKLAASWDGPYRFQHALQNGAYKLEELSGNVIPRTWNSTHLKTYYS
uniref:Gypsy retrotransposon integrase-like protein 1 n=1 Tax=Cajanus cajan TaxID=3821 RepID=A0A151SXU7_CAJCA|nr:Gypsy retrotransposon integrase-like protein 1 [Cajanus cajan]